MRREDEKERPLKICAPDGRVGRPPAELAAAPSVLTGRRIAVLSNNKPNAALLMERIARRIAERTGAVFTGVVTKSPGAASPCPDDELGHLRGLADLVLTGSAD